jgi:hypothetical protein
VDPRPAFESTPAAADIAAVPILQIAQLFYMSYKHGMTHGRDG